MCVRELRKIKKKKDKIFIFWGKPKSEPFYSMMWRDRRDLFQYFIFALKSN